jgi:hypothetical protein
LNYQPLDVPNYESVAEMRAARKAARERLFSAPKRIEPIIETHVDPLPQVGAGGIVVIDDNPPDACKRPSAEVLAAIWKKKYAILYHKLYDKKRPVAVPRKSLCLEVVSEVTGVPEGDIRRRTHTAGICFARHLAMYVMVRFGLRSSVDAGNFMGRDHSSVLNSLWRVEVKSPQKYAPYVERISAELEARKHEWSIGEKKGFRK